MWPENKVLQNTAEQISTYLLNLVQHEPTFWLALTF